MYCISGMSHPLLYTKAKCITSLICNILSLLNFIYIRVGNGCKLSTVLSLKWCLIMKAGSYSATIRGIGSSTVLFLSHFCLTSLNTTLHIDYCGIYTIVAIGFLQHLSVFKALVPVQAPEQNTYYVFTPLVFSLSYYFILSFFILFSIHSSQIQIA